MSKHVLSRNARPHITHVIHIADTHVRTGDRISARIDEYRHVFNNFTEAISNIEAVRNGTALLVIAGDIFHHKGKLETEGGIMVYEWLNQLLNMMPVIVICGNHDFRQEDPNYKDMIEMLAAPYCNNNQMNPFHYLRNTGHYIWENIGFGVTSVKDTLQAYNTYGIITDLPKYPDPKELTEVECKVALFHGSVSQSAMPSGKEMSQFASGYPLEWFVGYDIAMLGDNHTQQLNIGLNNTLRWGYPGSLVQQDGGEPFLGHGYILWDIKKKKGQQFHVNNDYGILNIIHTKNDDIMVRIKPYTNIPLEKVMDMKEFPLYPQIRVVGVQGDDAIVSERLRSIGIKFSRVYLAKCSQISDNDQKEDISLDTFRSYSRKELIDLSKVTIWKKFVEQNDPDLVSTHAIDWLQDPSRLLINREDVPSAIQDKVLQKNKSIQNAIELYDEKKHGVYKERHDIVLRHMEWEYLMCYGSNNWFDFEKMDGKIALLNGKNASGKSSFIDVLCLAIFGDPTMMRSDIHGSKMSVKVIHDKKPTSSKHDSAYTRLLFTTNSELYEIKRSFTVKQKDEVLQSKVNKIATIHRIVDNVLVLVADGTTMVNEWISSRFGSLPEMLMSTILCQIDSSNFFHQRGNDQIHIIEKALHMETIQMYESILHEASKANRHIINEIITYMKGISDTMKKEDISFEELENMSEDMDHMLEEQKKNAQAIKNMRNDSDCLLVKIQGDIDTYGYEIEEAEIGLQEEQSKVESYKDITIDIIKEAHDTKIRLDEQEKLLKNLPRLDDKRIKELGGIEAIKKNIANTKRMIDNHLKKRPEEPNITDASIEERETEYNVWIRTVRYMEIDLENLEKNMDDLMNHQNRVYEEYNNLHKITFDITRSQSKHKEWLDRLKEWDIFLDDVPDTKLDDLRKRCEEIEKYIKNIDQLREDLNSIKRELDLLLSENDSYSNIEFNPDCSACRKNPLHKRIIQVKKRIKELETKYKKSQTKIKKVEETEDDYRTELEDIRRSIAIRTEYELLLDHMTKERKEWEISELLWKKKMEHDEKIKILHEDLKNIQQELHGLQKIRTELNVWEKERDRLQKEKERNREWKKWDNTYKSMIDTRNCYENTIKWEDLCEQKIKNNTLFERLKGYEDAVKERNEWENILLSIKWTKLTKQLDDVMARYHDLQYSISMLEAKTKGTLEKMKLIRSCESSIKNIQEKQEILQRLVSVFVGDKGNQKLEGFKAWIYRTEVLPMIEMEINRFIEPLDNIRLRIRYHNGELLYNIEDRGNFPSLDHASGYQRFLIGIAMRIALARIGAVGQNVLHIIIDEGFVACDSSNILKVDAILKSMMEHGNYMSILLMSHLDMIRDIAQLHVNIYRSDDDVFSKISWGSTYPIFQKYNKSEIKKEPNKVVENVKRSRGTLKKIK